MLTLGDNQYERGEYDAYLKYFDQTWGRALDNLHPAPGNHEYGNDPSATPDGYFRCFGNAVKGPDGLGYYSFNIGACPNDPCWHLISLNSELCFTEAGCGPASDPSDPGPGNMMYAWLEQDLAAHPDSQYPVHARVLASPTVLLLDRQRGERRRRSSLAAPVRSARRRRAERPLA